MNIIIPLGGIGKRFTDDGYNLPKPLIKIFDKTMIEYVLDNLSIRENDEIYIIYNSILDNHHFCNFIQSKYPDIHFIRLNHNTSGASETLLIGTDYILKKQSYNKKTLVIDCDTYYTEDIVTKFRESENNAVFFTKKIGEPEIYSYIELDEDLTILNIAEKRKISNNANTGAYAFIDIEELHKYCNYVINNKITFNNESYTSCVIKEMLNSGVTFKGIELNSISVFSLGTPKELDDFKTNRFAFFFDLDGTIVLTDDIYFSVWFEILKEYNLTLTNEMFKNYIQGNNDDYVLKTLLPNMSIELEKISEKKDLGFIENISKLNVINGAEKFISSLKRLGHKCCIVTNCNRRVANYIINYIGFDKYVDFIISSDDCLHGKPNPEPYLKALEKCNISCNKSIIFEDSKTGILSGRSINPKLMIGLQTLYSDKELKKCGVNESIVNYEELSVNDIMNSINSDMGNIENMIKGNVLMNITELIIDNNKLKGGYIADVIGVKIKENKKMHHYVLKYENKNVTSLSTMANQLCLYEREYYFYETISKHVNINIPKFIAFIKDDTGLNCGVLLENLLIEPHFSINLNLSKESINVSLRIIDSMTTLHSKFWNKNLDTMFPGLKNTTNAVFRPFMKNFICDKMPQFKENWSNIILDKNLILCNKITEDFNALQLRLSEKNITLIHGDIKSPNIIYDRSKEDEPYFIDWQHCGIGKGTQDLIFFIIESFDLKDLSVIYPLLKNYYYKKLLENGVQNYSYMEYEKDLLDSIWYVPFFTAVWFGTTPTDDLIDKNFPFFFIQKLFYLQSII
jgi:HAD superfamily hydrolase (TIGR01509 family)